MLRQAILHVSMAVILAATAGFAADADALVKQLNGMNLSDPASIGGVEKIIAENGDAGGLYLLKSVLHVKHGETLAGMNCLRIAVNCQLIVDGPILKFTREKLDEYIKESQDKNLDHELGGLLVIRSVALLVAKDMQSAMADLNLAEQKFPRLPEVYNTRGICRHVLGDEKNALEDYDKAIQLNPNYADAFGNRAGLYKRMGDDEHAKRDRIRYVMLLNRLYGMSAGELNADDESPPPESKNASGAGKK